ncbi:MAG: ABC transporter ATP-binding protein, partial [Candidatus Carbobacillus altaicus]|nr:ABC transporter ATP-binding protein [Candidatus Carbobacillus altaicus]
FEAPSFEAPSFEAPSFEAPSFEAHPFLEVRAVKKSFRDAKDGDIHLVLSSIHFTVNEGEFVTVIGPSGSGKSTLLNIIAGLLPPDEGSVWMQGERQTARAGKVAYMMQDDLLFPWQSVKRHVAMPLRIQGVGKRAAEEQAERILKTFDLIHLGDRYPKTLSGGQKQRVALARAYIQGTALLLLDEPFGRLDALTREDLQAWLETIWLKEKRTVLMVTHDIEEALFLGDRVIVLSARPARIVLDLPVPFARPRKKDVRLTDAFVAFRKTLMQALAEDTQRL